MTPQPRCNALSIVVSDMARSVEFYRLCGLDLPADVADQPHVEAEAAGGFRLMFDTVGTVRSFDPDWEPPKGGHRMALAMQCAGAAEVDTAYRRLLDAGYDGHLAPFDAFWGQRYAVVNDPDGNPVDFYAALPSADG
jgi:uncharacterized glyoxalase superfamily protein PhnB